MTTQTASTTTLQIDRAHSELTFHVRHLISKVRGHFSEFDGQIQFDAERPERSSVSLTVQVASIDTRQSDRDAHLRSDDFFAAATHPTLTFVSRAITARGAGTFDVTGDLSIRGITREVTIPVTYLGAAKDPWGNQKHGFEGTFTINRKDFGLSWNAALETGGFLVGDDVTIGVSIQAAPAA